MNDRGGAPTFVVADSDGNFYGTSPFTSSSGAFLQISSAGSVSVLHSFAVSTDGKFPNANIVEGSDGAFYGSTPEGGSSGLGTLFRVDTTGAFSVISNITNSSDLPLLTTLGDDGNIYGIIPFNTTQNHGSIFKMTNSGTEPRSIRLPDKTMAAIRRRSCRVATAISTALPQATVPRPRNFLSNFIHGDFPDPLCLSLNSRRRRRRAGACGRNGRQLLRHCRGGRPGVCRVDPPAHDRGRFH